MNQTPQANTQQLEIERLRDRVEELESILTNNVKNFPAEWRLTRTETKVLAFLLTKDVANRGNVLTLLYSFVDNEPEPRVIDMFVYKLRKKLKFLGVQINPIWGVGYRISAEHKAIIEAKLSS